MSSPDPDLIGDETHHLRNPLRPVQPLRKHNRATLSDAEKAALVQRRKARKQVALAYEAELEALQEEIDERVKNISTKYSKKERAVHSAVHYVSRFTKKRTNTWNDEVSYRAMELQATGEYQNLRHTQQIVMEERHDREEKDIELPLERIQAIRAHAREKRDLKENGTRPTNRSAAKDANFTTKCIQSEINKANKRTGLTGLLILARGHVQDPIAPTVFETSNAEGFTKHSLGVNLADVGHKLESFALAGSKARASSLSIKTMRKECVNIISDGLNELVEQPISMNYDNYNTYIVERHKIKLQGWPARVPFKNPSKLRTDELQRLRDALVSRRCTWIKMTRSEIDEHTAELDDVIAAGGSVGKPRKERSDKGKKRRVKETQVAQSEDDQGNLEPLRKKKKVQGKNSKSVGKKSKAARQFPPTISPELVDSSDDDDEVALPTSASPSSGSLSTATNAAITATGV